MAFTRRNFIGAASAATAAVLATGNANAQGKGTGKRKMKDLKIALLQIDSNQNDIAGNLKKITTRVEEASRKKANLMISCELGMSAFLFSRAEYLSVAQTIPGPATDEVGVYAKKANSYVVFGLPEKDGGDLYNSIAVVGPKGNLVAKYRKMHLWLTENPKT